MAQKHRPDKSLDDLRQEIAHSRDRLGRDLSGLSYELDFPLKLKKSFQRQSKVWAAGAMIIGVLLSFRRGGKRTIMIEKGGGSKKGQEQKKGMVAAGLAMGGLRLVGTLLRPMVMSYLAKKVGGYAGRVR